MGFSEGTDDEFLLTCFVCKKPFGMLAAFCGGCGSKRDQAMGVERAKSSQQISANVIQTPSFEEQFLLPKTEKVVETPFTQSKDQSNPFTEFAPKPKSERKPRKKSIKRQIFVSNIYLRINAISQWQSRRARLLNSSGVLLMIGATFLFTQSFIVGTSDAEAAAEKYLKSAVTREISYFDLADEVDGSESHPIFPVQFTPGENAADWLYTTSITGLFGRAEISTTPSGSQFDPTPITIKMRALYKPFLGVFRTPEWVPAEQPATITIDYPSTANTLIYINGFAAGSTSNPTVKEGTYFIFPGALEITYYVDGESTSDSFEIFIQASGNY